MHTIKNGDSFNEKCRNCDLNCNDMYSMFRRKHPYDLFLTTTEFINNNIPCLTKTEWLIKEVLE